MIADSEEEIDLITELVVDPDTDAMDASKAVAEHLVDTVSRILTQSVMVFLNKLALLLRQGKHETSQSLLPFITKIENLVQFRRSFVKL